MNKPPVEVREKWHDEMDVETPDNEGPLVLFTAIIVISVLCFIYFWPLGG